MPIIDVESVVAPNGAVDAGLAQSLPERDELPDEVAALTSAIEGVLGRATSCVHVECAPAASRRLSFGDKLVT